MENSFDPSTIERTLYAEWEAAGYFAPQGEGDGYCIVIPPPNVTGSLHMGHAFQHTLMDVLIRFQRMDGRRALWQAGTDHAGIATQMLVERRLIAEGKTRHEVGRDAFVDLVWDWKQESGGNISQQLRRMGSSLDWTRERFTLDEGFSRAVREVFVQLYEDDLIYRGQRLVNWDPELGTAISDLEVDNRTEAGQLWHLRYPLVDARTSDGSTYLIVATTRPETMLGDTAVAVHPDDSRYADLIGKQIRLPLTDRLIPIIADSYVDQEFGTGCVKITPAHDFNDHEVGARHALPQINVFTATATLNDNAPDAYRGMDRFEAREQIIADLDAQGLLEKVEPHTLNVPRGDRSGAVVEPWLTDQWFVKIQPLADPAIEAVENGSVQFVPKQYENTYFAWMRDIKDWCISRQQWWGHRIPAWYDDEGRVFVGRSEQEVREKNGLSRDVPLRQDDDVLETWFSSAMWTFGTLGWPDSTPEQKLYHPTDVLVTGHDIIFFWVARMIMMTLRFTGEVPFRKVYVHGLVRDAEGQKMSKSKGNGLDPLDLIDGITLEALVDKRTSNLMQAQLAPRIEKATRKEFPEGIPAYGTDAIRFTFAAMASTGRDIRFDLKRIEGYRNFCNKLWNATKFVLMNTEDFEVSAGEASGPVDRWIQSRLQTLVRDSRRALDSYRFDLYANAVYEFSWHEFCDWYVELTKPLLWDDAAERELAQGARHTLLRTLETLLRIAHPIVPFITETLWREVAPRLGLSRATIMLEAFPVEDPALQDAEAEAAVEWLKGVVGGVRTIRGEANIEPGKAVDVLFADGGSTDRQRLEQTEAVLKRVAKINTIRWLPDGEQAPVNALALVGDLKVMVPLAGLIDVDAERARLGKLIDRKQGDLKRVRGKLDNPKFVDKAPDDVVAKERGKAEEAEQQLRVLERQLAALDAL